MKQLELSIEGMTCGHCVAAVRKALSSLSGIQVQDVQIGSARVLLEESSIDIPAISHAIESAGYRMTSPKV